MTQTAFRQAIEDYIRANALPPDKFSHQPRLYRLAVQIAGDKSFDDDVLHAAAWLHDLGVFIGHRPEDPAALAKWDNVDYAAQRTPDLLEKFGFPASKIPIVVEAILNHQPSGKPISFEAILLRDADILEQLGAVTVLRTVSKVGRDTRFIRFSDALNLLRRQYDTLPAQLKLESARCLAADRIGTLSAFLDAAKAEANGVDW